MAEATLFAIHILPPLAIGRFGESPTPMDNYEVTPDPDAPPQPGAPHAANTLRVLTPAATLAVDPATGKITGQSTPAAVSFRDDAGRIKPVCPFLEVWAQAEDGGPLEPLTASKLKTLNAAVQWRVHVANIKAFRRTGDPNDQVHARVDWFDDHAPKPLSGTGPNLKPGKQIAFGSVQFIDPASDGFEEIRLRFTPPAGKVFSPDAGDPNAGGDAYDATRGQWREYYDGRPGTPPGTSPGGIFYGRPEMRDGQNVRVSNGYLDDASDGIVEARVTVGNRTLTAYARVSAGPPAFAPDTYHVRQVADELEQVIHGPDVAAADRAAAIDIVRRAGETVRAMNTAVMNGNFPASGVSNMAGHDSGPPYRRAREPIFPVRLAAHAVVRQMHAGVVERMAVDGDFTDVVQIMRTPDTAGDLTDRGRRRMPGMMRGADGLHLTLTRRQLATLKAAESPAAAARPAAAGATAAAASTPEDNMNGLIDHFHPRRLRHLGIDVDATHTLADLFDDKPALLNYLRTANAKGARAEAQEGRPLVVAGKPDESAIVLLIGMPAHPMHGPLTTDTIGDTGKTGLQIIREWIESL